MDGQQTIFDLLGGPPGPAAPPPVAAPEVPSDATPLDCAALDAICTALVADPTLLPLDGPELPPGPRGTRLWVYDTEVFPNLVLHVFCDGREVRIFHHGRWRELAEFVCDPDKALVGFNSAAYDDVVLRRILEAPVTVAELVALSQAVVEDDEPRRPRRWRNSWGLSIDVHQLLNGRAGLKEWECRLGFGLVAETPWDFAKPLPLAAVAEVVRYCANDVHATLELLRQNLDLVAMRQRLHELYALRGDGIYCASEARIAESTMLELLSRDLGTTSSALKAAARANPDNGPRTWQLADLVSPRVAFATVPFLRVLHALRDGSLEVLEDGGIHLAVPGLDGMVARLAGTTFQLGIGGLHSLDRPGSFHADDATALLDLDVTSYYPSLIIAEGWHPRHLGPRFVAHLRSMRDQRVAAKQAGDKRTAQALKIVINSLYGKLNDRFSGVRSVPDSFRVTLNGQLFLLQLIERLAQVGATILGANTDGVAIAIPRVRMAELDAALTRWQGDTGFTLERTPYRAYFRRDVNNYLALGEDGEVKTRGAFGEGAKGDGAVIRRAAADFLVHGTDPAATVAATTRVEDFLFYHRTRRDSLLVHDGAVVGRTARWYSAFSGRPLLRRPLAGGADSTIAHGHRARLAFDVRGWDVARMADLDRSHYVAEAWRLIGSVGADPGLG